MLLLGTQILNWYWLVLLGGTGAEVALFRVLGARIAPYRVAQLLDKRFQLSDSLSTAWFLASSAGRREDSVAQFQIARAEELAESVRPADAFPFTRHRAWAVTGALAAAAFGLFAVRYMVTSSLSLKQSLIPIHLESVIERFKNTRPAEAHRALDSSPNEGSAKLFSPLARENAPRDASQPQDAKENRAEGAPGSASPGQNNQQHAGSTPQEGGPQTREGGRSGSEAKAGDKAEQSAGKQPGSKPTPAAKDPSARGQDGSAGLMDKMKDALSGLMAKMRPSQSSQGQPQNGNPPNGEGKAGDPKAASKDQSGQQQNAGNQQASQDQSSMGQAQGETKEKAQASEGRSSDQSPESGSDARSGVGSQDGDKGVKEAGQLQAMGKLEEIIGKRSANLTGEMSVEKPSNKQQLKTDYSQRQGHHSDLGGEINRDEIPLMYQAYVREYMEQVRKQGKSRQ